MEMLGVLAVLVALAIPVAVIALLVSVSRLKARVAHLEKRVVELALREVSVITQRPAAAEAAPAAAETVASEPVAEPAAPLSAEMPVAAATPPAEAPKAPRRDPWGSPAADTPARPAQAARPVPSGPSSIDRLGAWLRLNWVYAVSALSLALAGIFFVQYGMERGLLPPAARVTAAILFGLALIGGGEWFRRRWGDREGDATAYLPSTFSGAGIVSVFGGILAARQLYDLIGTSTAFAGLVATALLAIVLGWLYGPFLAAIGLLGAAAAPFAVGGDSDAPYWLYAYFVLIAGIGLFVDTLRRWAWVSVLALVLGYGGVWLVLVGTGGAGWAAFALMALALMAVLVPARGLAPDHEGPMVSEFLWNKAAGRVSFPVLLAAGAIALTSLLLLILPAASGAESVLALLSLAVLAVALAIWSPGARGLADLAAFPMLAFVLRVAQEALNYRPLYGEYEAAALALRAPETAAPMTAALILGLATLMTLAAAMTSGRFAGLLRYGWAAAAALVAPVTALALELCWQPALILGPYLWALHIIALAALMVAMALRFARADGADMRRAAYATLSALSLIALALIALALFLVTTKGALTVALAALLVAAAALDRRYRLPEMGWFIQAGVLLLGWRLIVDPGLGWAVDQAVLWEVIASYGGVALASFAALRLTSDLPRPAARAFLESGGASAAALLANVLITRWLNAMDAMDESLGSHWGIALNAMPWLIVALAQLYRMTLPGWLRWVRLGVAAVAGLIWAGGTIATLTLSNPVAPGWAGRAHLVRGPLLLDTLFVAYALPGIILLVALRFLGHLHRWARLAILGVGTALVALYAALEIRRFWRGPDLSVPGVTQAELYSYTVALMLLGAGLLYQAIARRSDTLRRIAMAVIALTIAKVFLIDASGLTGLTRVFSFLALGLSLAGLAWLNRWAAGRNGAEG
jgi:uncharacterized membrane protein